MKGIFLTLIAAMAGFGFAGAADADSRGPLVIVVQPAPVSGTPAGMQFSMSEHLDKHFAPLRMAAKQQTDFMAIVSRNLSKQMMAIGGPGPQPAQYIVYPGGENYGVIVPDGARPYGGIRAGGFPRRDAAGKHPRATGPASLAELRAAPNTPLLRESVARETAR